MTIDKHAEDRIRFQRAASDAFGRLRTSEPVTLFDYQSEYDNGSLVWENVAINGGTASFAPSLAAIELSVSTAPTDRIIRQTRQYHRYQPGKSQFVLFTFVFGAGQAGTIQRVGYGDDNNGIFLVLNGTTLQIVRRSDTSGSPVNTVVNQSSWNLDAMTDLDITKAQIFYVALEWLGVGSVQCGFVIDGAFRPAHQFNNANSLANVYMRTANLPVRYEVENTSTAAQALSMQAICTTVISEGGFETQRGYPFSVSNGITDKPINTRKPVLSIRPAPTYNGVVNRSQILLNNIAAHARSNSVFVQVLYNATLTSASYGAVNSNSLAQYDIDATSVSGGIEISSFYVPASVAAGPAAPSTPAAGNLGLLSRLPLTLDYSGSPSSSITIAATAFSATASISVSISWQELR